MSLPFSLDYDLEFDLECFPAYMDDECRDEYRGTNDDQEEQDELLKGIQLRQVDSIEPAIPAVS